MFRHAHSVGSKVVIASAGFLGLPHLRSEIVFNSDIYELNLFTPPHGVIIEAYAGVNISRSSTQYASLEILVGDHQLASVAQQRRSHERGAERRHGTQRQENQAGLPIVTALIELVHHFLAVHKEQSESHKSQKFFIISHLQLEQEDNFPSNLRKFPESQLSRSARSTNNIHRPIPSNILPRSALTKSQLSQYHYQARKNGSYVD